MVVKMPIIPKNALIPICQVKIQIWFEPASPGVLAHPLTRLR
jgi:hypothetical protein